MTSRQASALRGAGWGWALLAVLATLVLTGCDSGRPPPLPRYDDELSEALARVLEGSQAVRFVELTDFEWDTVYAFRPYTDGHSINSTVGQDVVRTNYQHDSDGENVLVFVLDGSLAHAAEVRRIGLEPPGNEHFVAASSDAWLVPPDPSSRGRWLTLVEQLPDE